MPDDKVYFERGKKMTLVKDVAGKWWWVEVPDDAPKDDTAGSCTITAVDTITGTILLADNEENT